MAGRVMLCARCTVTLYRLRQAPVWTVKDGTNLRDREMKEVSDALALAELGTAFMDLSGAWFRPLAVTQVNGTLMCGQCAAGVFAEKGFRW